MECTRILGYWVSFQPSALTYNHLPYNELIKCPLITTCSLGDGVSKKFFRKRSTISSALLLAGYFFFPLLSKVIFPFQCSSYSQLSFTIQNNSLTSLLLYNKYFHPLFCKLYNIGSFNFSLWLWSASCFSILLLSFTELFVIYFDSHLTFISFTSFSCSKTVGREEEI